MPRKARIDALGALHHIIFRGIERRKVFWDGRDQDQFVERLGTVLSETGTPCFAWALIPNHAHLLLRTGNTPLSTVMRRLLTGHAAYFNHRTAVMEKFFKTATNRFSVRKILTFLNWLDTSIDRIKSDERILGDSDFVEEVLRSSNEKYATEYALKAKGYDLDTVAERVCQQTGIEMERLWSKGKQPGTVQARRVAGRP